MKKQILFLLIAFFSVSISAMAQEPQHQGNGGGGGNRQQMDPKTRAEQMAKDLELTDEQKTQVQTLFEEQQVAFKKLREEAGDDQEARRAKMQEFRKKSDTDLEKIIGKEKLDKHKAMQAERMRNRENGNGGQRREGGERPGPAPR
jgi:Spy/CpxP family protein refolding chaperone